MHCFLDCTFTNFGDLTKIMNIRFYLMLNFVILHENISRLWKLLLGAVTPGNFSSTEFQNPNKFRGGQKLLLM